MRATELFTGGFKMMKTYSSTAWMLIIPLFIVNLAVQYFNNRASEKMMEAMMADPLSYNPFTSMGPMFLGLLISLFLGAIVAVGWHRRALLNENFSWSPAKMFRKPVYSYLLGILLLFLILMGVSLVAGLSFGIISAIFVAILGNFALIILIPAVIALMLFSIAIFNRISIYLPARAVEKPISLSDTWNATKGQSWMLIRFTLLFMLVIMVVLLPFSIPSFSAQMELQRAIGMGASQEEIMALLAAAKPSLFVTIFMSMVSAVIGIYQIGIMTILYATFVTNQKSVGA